MDTASLAQPGRQFEFLETVQELVGTLEVPEHPSATAGYADIYRGFWITPHGERVQVAIKELRTLIPNNRQTEPEALKRKADLRLKREAFVWSQTTHRNLHPLLGYCLRPRPRLISPWCSQGNLKDYLEANPGLTRCQKLRLIFQTGCGLKHLHSRTPPICHADIKPENVLIHDWYGPALSDFGLSRVVQDLEAQSGLTTSETVKGTVRYMASELFAGQKPSPESDVYAFGGLILTVMSGKAPFDGLLHHVILRRVMLHELPIPKDHPYLPAHDSLWKLVRRCWNHDPTARPTIQEVLRELSGQIIREESNSGPRLDLTSAIGDGANEYGDMDLDMLCNGPSLTTNAVPAAYSVSGVPVAEIEHYVIPSGGLLLATRKTLKGIQLNSKVIPVIGKYIGATAEVGLSLLEIAEAMNQSENLSNSLELCPRRLANILQDLGEYSRQHRGGNIRALVTEMQKELEVVQEKIKERYSSNLVRNEVSLSNHASEERGPGAVRKVLEEIQFLLTLDTTGLLNELENTVVQEQNRRLLNRLGDGKYGAHGNAIEDLICLPGTRVEILERIDNWIRDESAPDRVFWIRGVAGRGKSTIASTVAHSWQSRASCAIFHFRRGRNTLNTRIFCALATQLVSSLIPEVRNAVLESVQENEDIADQRLDVQFETLIVVPLSNLVHHSHTILIVVDALDESQNPKDVVDFVKLIDQHSSSFPTNVKFLLTCRPEAQIVRALEPRRWLVEDLDSSVNVVDDLALFIKQGCTQIREDHGLSEDWPASSDIRSLVEMSQGLFQWARAVITYIGTESPMNRLRDLLRGPSTWNGLDDLYHQILSKAFDTARLDVAGQELLCSILGTLVVGAYPVSLEVIAALYGDNSIFKGVDQEGVIEDLRQDILVDLNSLLLIPTSPTETIRLIHTSLRDLLISGERCKKRAYYIDVNQHHERLASLCLGIMARCLKGNICNLSDLSKPNSEVQDVIEREVSPAIRYCCRAWSMHLTEGTQWSRLAKDSTSGHRAVFETFSSEKLLYWLEVMSLIGATAETIITARRVHSWLSQYPDKETSGYESLVTLWSDAQRFITAFFEPISFGALHIYASALAHCPQKTELWKCYGRHAKIRTLHGIQPLTWPANLWTRHVGEHVYTVAFSPDGGTGVLASGSSDGTIQLWDACTGTPLGQPFKTDSDDFVCSVAFSRDGKILASGSGYSTIRLWDARTGTPLGQSLTGHSDDVHSVAFSPDGKVLASGSNDRTIRLWDVQTGRPLGQPLKGHSEDVRSVVFSPDGKVLASGSYDGTVRLWDAQTGTTLGNPLRGHNGHVLTVAFSPGGKILASGHEDSTIRLWDAQTGTPLGQRLTGHSGWVLSIAFSPNGNVLASGADDSEIRLWGAQAWTPLGQPLTGHGSSVESVAFSQDSKLLASGSFNGTIGLWDVQTGTPLGQPLVGLGYFVCSVAFSLDGNILATGLPKGNIRLWNAQTWVPLGESLTGHDDAVISVAFSPDGKVLASGSMDGTIRLWDTQTGTTLCHPLAGHNHYVTSVAFSPDGKVLASGSYDHTSRLWDARTKSPLGQRLIGHSGTVQSVAFSPDAKVLASGSRDHTIRLWDVQTRTPLGQPLTGHSSEIRSVAFSPDGEVLASGSFDRTIRLWDAQTGAGLPNPMTGDNNTISFIPNSRAGPRGPLRLAYCIPNIQDHWVKISPSRLFWLPFQYWDDESPTTLLSNDTLVILSNGTLSIFDVSQAFHL